MRRRVVVTGVGLINPMGHNVETVWNGLKEGRSGVGYTTIFDATSFPTQISAEVKDFDLSRYVDDISITKYWCRHTRFAVGAARQAVDESGILDGSLDPTRFGVYLGSGEGDQDFTAFTHMMTAAMRKGGFDMAQFTKAGLEHLNPLVELEQEPNMPAGH